MTLNIMAAAPWGIWQCSDFRLTDTSRDQPLDIVSDKHVQIVCRDGTMMVTYTGVGRDKNGVETSDWLLDTLGGMNLPVHETVKFLRQRSTEWITRNGNHGHAFAVGAFVKGVAWVFLVSNVMALCSKENGKVVPLREPTRLTAPEPVVMVAPPWMYTLPEMKVTAAIAETPMVLVAGSGKVVKEDLDRLAKAFGSPQRKKDHLHKLLADVNRRVALDKRSCVSEGCQTHFLPADGGVEGRIHHQGDAMLPMKMVLFGIDLTPLVSKVMSELSTAGRNDP